MPDFLMTDWVLNAIRIVATVAGAVIGWIVCDPVTRILYRIMVRAATPGWLLPWTKLAGAGTLATLVYFFLPLGGGGGAGWGPGLGGSPGKGPGDGGGKAVVVNSNAKDSKSTLEEKKKQPDKIDREVVEIEILGGTKFKNDGLKRYYKLKDTGADAHVFSYGELKQYFEQKHGKIQVRINVTDDSTVSPNEKLDPTRLLRKLMDDENIARDPKSNDG